MAVLLLGRNPNSHAVFNFLQNYNRRSEIKFLNLSANLSAMFLECVPCVTSTALATFPYTTCWPLTCYTSSVNRSVTCEVKEQLQLWTFFWEEILFFKWRFRDVPLRLQDESIMTLNHAHSRVLTGEIKTAPAITMRLSWRQVLESLKNSLEGKKKQ